MALLLPLAAPLIIDTASGRAATCGVPVVEVAEAREVHSTRAHLFAAGTSGCEVVQFHFEYATSNKGPWEATEGETRDLGPGSSNGYAVDTEIHHLLPNKSYYARAFVENDSGLTLKQFSFTTAPVDPPEVTKVRPVFNEATGKFELGTTFAAFEAHIESNGAETTYRFKYATSKEGPWTDFSSGASGSVTVGGDFADPVAHLEGLVPETTYYARVEAENKEDEGKPVTRIESFKTEPLHPEASIGDFGKVGATTAQVSGTVIPRSSETHWRFEYATSEAGPWTVGPGGTITALEADENYHLVKGELKGLQESTSYYVRVFAENGHEPNAYSQAVRFETSGAPVVGTFAVHALDGENIRALGSVKPNGYDTHYHFEYVTQEEYETSGWAEAQSTHEEDAGSGEVSNGEFPTRVVGADLAGLQAGATYRYRMVASSTAPGNPVVHGDEQTVKVPVPGKTGEGREEGQSTPCPNEALRTGPSAALPDCRAYELVTPVDKEGAMDIFSYAGLTPASVLVGEDGDHMMVRGQFTKWGSNVDAVSSSYLFSHASAGWRMTGVTPQPEAAQNSYGLGLYGSDLTDFGVTVGWSTGTFNLSTELELKIGPAGGPYVPVVSAPRVSKPKWLAASADFGKVILGKAGNLYEWANGELRQVNIGVGSCGATIAEGSGGHAVSADGSRVFFKAAPASNCEESHLYIRQDGNTTIDIGAYKFLAANADGTQLLLIKQSGETRELLLYETETATAKPLLTTHREIGQPIVSEQLTALYFRSKEQLTPEAPPPSAESEDAGPSSEDLYRYDIPGKSLRFVLATSQDGGGGGGTYVSPDGRYYYWPSVGVSAVFREVDPGAGDENAQAYRYDSVENVVQCMSCASPFNPRPQRFATFLPEGVEGTPDSVPNPTVASANGDYVFFDTAAALVPQDVNGEVHPSVKPPYTDHGFFYSVSSDVYEWRKDGIDGCAYVQGCVALISSGTGGLKNMLLGTTASGRDVFIATHSQLVRQDTDTAGDVYDVRIGGGVPPPPRQVECEGDACQSPMVAPIDTTPASLAFSGPGNPVPVATPTKKGKPKAKLCRKGTTRKKGKCVKKTRAKRAVRRAVVHNKGGGK
jgi:hypothetical protein